jgi:hypothetical protein
VGGGAARRRLDEIAVAGTIELIDAVLANPRLGARVATTDDVLDGDD